MGSGSSKPASSNSTPKKQPTVSSTAKYNSNNKSNNNNKSQQKKEQTPVTIGECINNALTKLEPETGIKANPSEIPAIPEYFTEIDIKWDTNSSNDVSDLLAREVSPITNKKHAANINAEGVVKGNVAEWVPRRKKEAGYTLPSDGCLEKVTEVSIDLDADCDKRDILAFGGIHFGRPLTAGTEANVREFLDDLLTKATDQVHTVVLLGDILEMWLDTFDASAQTPNETLVKWKNKLCEYFVSCIQKLSRECGVKVYFIRGNHDHEVAVSDVERLFGDSVTFIQGTLVYRIQDQGKEYRIRFSHGHEWDLFTSYSLESKNQLLCKKPIGYYVSRAMCSINGAKEGVVEKLLQNFTATFLEECGPAIERDLVKALSVPQVQERFLTCLLSKAMPGQKLDLDTKCVVDDGKYITLRSMTSYPLVQFLCEQHGEDYVLNMMKATAGDYCWFVKQCDEDVVVLAHDVSGQLRKYKANNGNDVIYVNCGSWTNEKEFSTVTIHPPKKNIGNGRVTLDCKQLSQSNSEKQKPVFLKTEGQAEVEDELENLE